MCWAYGSKSRVEKKPDGEEVMIVEGRMCFYCYKVFTIKHGQTTVRLRLSNDAA